MLSKLSDRKLHLYLEMARAAANFSKDRSTKVGAIILTPDYGFSMGYNGFPRGINDDVDERHERPEKYQWVSHAEMNSITNAARAGLRLKGSTLFCTKFPCTECCKALIQAGIETVVTVPETDPNWMEQIKTTCIMFEEAGVTIVLLEEIRDGE